MDASTFFDSVLPAGDLETDMQRARALANWLDAKFNILGYRFGIEGIIGLIPVVGDALGVVAGAYPIYVARRHKLGTAVQVQMAANLAMEWWIGLMPVVGDIADIWYKANLRNLRLLEKAAAGRGAAAKPSSVPRFE